MSGKFLPAFKHNQDGGVLVTFAVTATVLLGLVGAGIDFAKAYSARTKLQKAADMGALAGANDPYQAEGQARQTAMMFFESAKTSLVRDVNPKYDVQRSQNGSIMSVTVWAEAAIDTSLLRVMGVKNLPLSVSATAMRPTNAIDIYVAMDMSASMGLAADEENRKKLVELTKPYSLDGKGCAFACHSHNSNVEPPGMFTYEFARTNGVKLREDVMLEAFGSFVDEMLDANDVEVKNGMRRISTYGFSDDLTMLQTLTSTPTTIKQSVKLFPDEMRQSTLFEVALPNLASTVGKSGLGTAADRKKMVLLVTDGVRWHYGKFPTSILFDPKMCDELKNNGVDVAVLEVAYFEDNSETVYFVPYIKPYYPKLTPTLQSCASPGLYFKVQDTADAQIKDGFAQVARAMKPKLALIQ